MLSWTVRCGERAGLLDDVADAAAELRRGACLMSVPSSRQWVPSVGSIRRLIIRSEVVLPQPLGPTKTIVLPSGTSRSSASTATVPSG